MVVLVVLVVEHKHALKTFEEEGMSLLDKSRMPIDVAEKIQLQHRIFDPSKSSGVSFDKFIQQGGFYNPTSDAPTISGIVVLYEEKLSPLLKNVRNAVFAASIPSIKYAENMRNFLIGQFIVLLGNYGLFTKLIVNAEKHQAASLPIRNFNADELRNIVEICTKYALEKTFQNRIIPSMNALMNLRGPKRRSSYPHNYFKDDSNKYFRFGHEHHSRFETGGRHTAACMINGLFRFGWAIEDGRHFNVTIGNSDKAERIDCSLLNCHDETVETRNKTHINMFSNDYH